jgi:methanogenic corrinoid protein MtbC1
MTHGICKPCLAREIAKSGAPDTTRLEQLRVFYDELRTLARSGRRTALYEAVAKGIHALALGPLDLFMGIIQPILHELGSLWEQGELTVAQEHLFTAFAEELLVELSRSLREKLAADGRPLRRDGIGLERIDVLLACASGNSHVLGVKALELCLLDAGIACLAITPGLPPGELLDLAREWRPTFLAVSVSLAEQLAGVEALARALAKEVGLQGVSLLVGGSSVRRDFALWSALPGVTLAPGSVDELIGLIRSGLRRDELSA